MKPTYSEFLISTAHYKTNTQKRYLNGKHIGYPNGLTKSPEMFQVKTGCVLNWNRQQTVITLLEHWISLILVFNKRTWRCSFAKNAIVEVQKIYYQYTLIKFICSSSTDTGKSWKICYWYAVTESVYSLNTFLNTSSWIPKNVLLVYWHPICLQLQYQ